MAKADGLETSDHETFRDKRDNGSKTTTENHADNERLDVFSDRTGAMRSKNTSQCLAHVKVYGEQPHACEQCKAEETAVVGDDVFHEQVHEEEIASKDGDGVRTGGSGCSSPANSTAAMDRDLRLQVGSPGAWSPSSSQVHFIADSPLTPTRFRSKSDADTSTNPIHAQPTVGKTGGMREHRTSSASAVERSSSSSGFVQSPRGEPAGSASGSLSLHGTVTREGEMLSFVADDLLEKIRQSGEPLKAKDRGSPGSSSCPTPSSTCLTPSSACPTPSSSCPTPSSTCPTPSSTCPTPSSTCPTPSSSHSRTPSLSPSAVSASSIPPVDPAALNDIERHCRRAADNVELMLGHISSMLQNMSAITVGHTQTYRDAVDKAGTTVDQSVKCMYALIAKCEELNKTMEPVHELASQIKSVKRLLEDLEAACK